jgi:hypothetical protein
MRTAFAAILGCAMALPAGAEVRPPDAFYKRAEQLAEWINRTPITAR